MTKLDKEMIGLFIMVIGLCALVVIVAALANNPKIV
jgi:hypothetical protein